MVYKIKHLGVVARGFEMAQRARERPTQTVVRTGGEMASKMLPPCVRCGRSALVHRDRTCTQLALAESGCESFPASVKNSL